MSLLVKCTVPVYVGSVFPYGSWAAAVKVKLVPTVGLPPVARANRLAGAALTVIGTVVVFAAAASETVIVCDPAVASVTENEPWPFVSLESGGSLAAVAASLLLKCTVPPYWAIGFPRESAAVTSIVNG